MSTNRREHFVPEENHATPSPLDCHSHPAYRPGAWADQTANWQLDPVHSLATFLVAHMGISQVRGEFSKVSGSGFFDGQHLDKANVNASIDVNSLDTREEKRDAHLKSPDFLDAARYPTITFVSQRFRQKTPTTFQVVGDLTIHGVTSALCWKAP